MSSVAHEHPYGITAGAKPEWCIDRLRFRGNQPTKYITTTEFAVSQPSLLAIQPPVEGPQLPHCRKTRTASDNLLRMFRTRRHSR